MNVDGSGLKRLTNTPGVWEWAPDWSPDGRRIVCTDDKAIYVLGADGSGMAKWGGNYVHDLSEGASWGPGSRHIAYAWHCRDCEKPSSGLVVQAAGARPTTLLSSVASGWPMKSWTEYADCDWWGPKG
jgi:hypothetical protein